jgi:hypothetical protein
MMPMHRGSPQLATRKETSAARHSMLWRRIARPRRFQRVASTFGGWRIIQSTYGLSAGYIDGYTGK